MDREITIGRMQTDGVLRLRVVIRGAVQGVGFRPFIYRLATGMGLPGWVLNSAQGVFIEVEGSQAQLDAFLLRIEPDKPPRAAIHSLEASFLDPAGFTAFEIRHSDDAGEKTVLVLPDLATCPDCRREIFDPADRRHGYAFTNCTNCGPRYSIIEALPYDRPNTSMKAFALCDACRAEYEDPRDRRFHAQPIACPVCGPRLALWGADGGDAAGDRLPLQAAADAVRRGLIVAVKGLGGFHLMVDARDEDAVRRLRARKRREEKPFALMMPSLEAARTWCEAGALEERLLLSAEAPIVLLRKRSAAGSRLSSVSPDPNPYLGVMLPYTPLHHLWMAELGFPVVATSGNLSDEPICIDEHEALERLRGIADLFLVHNRPIVRHVDDSIARVVAGRELVLRRARGYAPLPVSQESAADSRQPTAPDIQLSALNPRLPTRRILAVGAHLKNAAALAMGGHVFISQHIGDLETAQAYDAFQRVIRDLSALYEFRPTAVARDLHPDYLSSQFAEACALEQGLPQVKVQHHFAHVAACMADNGLDGTALGVAWDGTGYGMDGAIWGGEFLRVDPRAPERLFTRVAHLRPFRLPGGDAAVKEPRRAALGVLWEMFGEAAFDLDDLAPVAGLSAAEKRLLRGMLRRGVNAPVTTSAGRLFDAVAALAGLRQRMAYEGQAAMELEFAAAGELEIGDWRLGIGDSLDWAPLIRGVMDAARRRATTSEIAGRFHAALAEAIVDVARRCGEERVILTGGCFQNAVLLERAVAGLRAAGFRPYWHQRVPPNDGGIALGQAVAAGWALR
jgi:hydrogenase maturation protein HypF